MELSERLYHWRIQKNMSIDKLSRLSGVSQIHIRNIENGKKQPTFRILHALTDGLNITLSEFFKTEENHIFYLSESEFRMLEYYRRLPKKKADILTEFYERMTRED